ncbi:SRPBCC domain-containing protein [Nocardiopsis sediminis]|uniref:SRPBCC domain-containing protein n=1 Tax=Nocardiopsis sediminis TaxID=1778267 RepID=A0ABV8FRW1_9ACTN
MRSFRDAKAMAKTLRAELAARGTTVPHSAALEIVARQFGFDDWNVLAARIGAARPEPGPRAAVPVLRIFSVDVVLPARIGRVWELITRSEHVRAWFAFDGAAVDLRPGGEVEHVWHEHGRYRGVIEEVVPGARFVYRYSSVPDARPEPGRQTTVVFTLEELADGSTRVRVTEEGFEALEMGDADRRAHEEGARQGWQGALDGLARLAAPAGEGPA